MADAGVMADPFATQLVQYSNDAVDMYYSDGSRLQLSACGTAFRYYYPPNVDQHPLVGQRHIQQRTEFVTSEFRPKVLDAVDFRNKFSERPFLCRRLLQETNIVRLHADIVEVAWPCELSAADLTVLPDAAVRLVSADEYAAITMAPHRQYFTTEVLSRVSQRRRPRTMDQRASEPLLMKCPVRSPPCHRLTQSGLLTTNRCTSILLSHAGPRSCNPDLGAGSPQDGDRLSGKPDQYMDQSVQSELGDKWEYVWMSQHHSLVDCPPCWRHPVALLCEYLQVPVSRVTADSKGSQATRGGGDAGSMDHRAEERGDETKPVDYKQLQDQIASLLHPTDTDPAPAPAAAVPAGAAAATAPTDTNAAHSAPAAGPDPCPAAPRRLQGPSALSATERRGVTLQRLLKKDFAGCIFIAPSRALPLSCPSLHLHRWRPDVITADDNDRAEAAYMYGKVKVICTQGVIYKLVWCTPRSVEVYPGDGSLMRSTGLSGHFFTHFMYSPDKEAERTYSTQSPPPTVPGAPYSVAKLITRAARFLKHLCEESLHSLLTDDPCCWAVLPGDTEPVEPLPTVTLEQTLVETLGHFTAFSNGHVRVLFNDRTSLDMACDFSKRVLHGADAKTVKRYAKRHTPFGLSVGMVRLLLRTGYYQNVDVNHPEPYQHYVEVALHWAAWVNTLPAERCHFYEDTIYDQDKQRSIESELNKIKCFNYIVDNVITNPHQKNSPSPDVQADSGLGCGTVSTLPSRATLDTDWTGVADHVTGEGHVTKHLANQHSGSFDMAAVQSILQRTADAVANLDRFMKKAARTESS